MADSAFERKVMRQRKKIIKLEDDVYAKRQAVADVSRAALARMAPHPDSLAAAESRPLEA